jgi:UDP-3-O-[3-hydroxymyristoyl] N-acetylglucosamine deacetylase
MIPFRTLARSTEISGIGLHTGAPVKVGLQPREAAGLVFARTDLPGVPEIPASPRHIGSTHHATTLTKGDVAIGTPEHLLAALWCSGVTNCRIEISAPEVPILDGSAAPWCDLIERAGYQELDSARPEYSLRSPVVVESRGGAVIGLPYDRLRATVDVEFSVEYLSQQLFAADVTAASFASEIAPARTFTLESWIAPLRALGLIRGGSIDNAIVFGEDGPSSPLRFENELARHKAVDLLGDIALLFGQDGGVLHAQLIAIRAGHELHRQWMEEALRSGALEHSV